MRGIAVGYEKMAQRIEQHACDVDAVYRGAYAARCRRGRHKLNGCLAAQERAAAAGVGLPCPSSSPTVRQLIESK